MFKTHIIVNDTLEYFVFLLPLNNEEIEFINRMLMTADRESKTYTQDIHGIISQVLDQKNKAYTLSVISTTKKDGVIIKKTFEK